MPTDTITISKGYKSTEIGVIPVDWDIEKLGDISTKVGSGITPTGGEKVYKLEGRPFLRSQNIGWGNLILDDVVFIDDEIHNTFNSTEIKEGDVFLNITGASIGRSGIADKRVVNGNVNQHVCIIRTQESLLTPQYLNYFLLSNIGQSYIDSFQAGGNRQGLNFEQIKSIQVIKPSIPEQDSIVGVLSDTDALIRKLEKLIQKKKSIKQGAMQELLTGKRRLPGFSGEWEEKPISKFTWFQEGPGVRTHQFTQSGVKLLNGTNIFKGKLLLDNTNRFISESEAYGPYSHFLVDEGDIVIASSGITVDKFEEKISFVKKEHLPLCMNTSTIRFKIIDSLMEPLFLYYFFMSKKFKDQIGAQATGSAQLNFGPSHLEKVEIYLPKEKKEQTALATVLSDMDTEIERLESELAKYEDIKQGMMQTLLTGKIRLLTK